MLCLSVIGKEGGNEESIERVLRRYKKLERIRDALLCRQTTGAGRFLSHQARKKAYGQVRTGALGLKKKGEKKWPDAISVKIAYKSLASRVERIREG